MREICPVLAAYAKINLLAHLLNLDSASGLFLVSGKAGCPNKA